MTHTRSRRRAARIPFAVAVSAILGELALAAPAAAQGVIGAGSGRAGAIVAWAVALIGVVTGGVARSRSVRGVGPRNGRDGAIVALVTSVSGMALAVLHLVTSPGAIGTGNGRLGAIVALLLGAIGSLLGRAALRRSKLVGPRDA